MDDLLVLLKSILSEPKLEAVLAFEKVSRYKARLHLTLRRVNRRRIHQIHSEGSRMIDTHALERAEIELECYGVSSELSVQLIVSTFYEMHERLIRLGKSEAVFVLKVV